MAIDSSVDQEKLFGGEAGVGMCLSNNHIIPASDEVRWKLKMLRAGDHIRLKGLSGGCGRHTLRRRYFLLAFQHDPYRYRRWCL